MKRNTAAREAWLELQDAARAAGSRPSRERQENLARHFTIDVVDQLVYLATLINPVDHRLYAIIWDAGDEELLVTTPSNSRDEIFVWGQGALSDSDDPAGQTDCPRSHTPSGVAAKGRGLGLMLYSGLALAAAYGTLISRAKAKELGLPRMEPCISSSPSQRSGPATKWWREQVRRGFAEERSVEGECEDRETHEEIDAEDAGIDEERILGGLDEEGDVSNVRGELSGYVHFTFCPRGLEAQVLEASRVIESGMVLHANEAFVDSDNLPVIELPGKDVLLALDLSSVDDSKLVEYVVGLVRESGASRDQVEAWLDRSGAIDEPLLPGVDLGPTIPMSQYARNAATHLAAWKRHFGDLATIDADSM